MYAELLVEACDPVFIPNLVNILCARNGTMLVIASAKTQSHVAKDFALEMNTQKAAKGIKIKTVLLLCTFDM